MTSARPHPPSSQRSADARASGHVPRPPLVGFGAGLLGLLGSAHLLGPQIARTWGELLREPLALVAAGASTEAQLRAADSLRALLSSLALGLLACFGAVLLGLLWAQGPSFARLSSARTSSFASLRPSRSASALWCLGLLAIAGHRLSTWTELERTRLSAIGLESLSALLVLTLACLVIDAAFARARFFASLWLTRREHVAEQRDAFGAPEVRQARERARRLDA